jgi:hypothetical protein
VSLAQTSGGTQREIAQDLGVGLATLVLWKGRSRDQAMDAPISRRSCCRRTVPNEDRRKHVGHGLLAVSKLIGALRFGGIEDIFDVSDNPPS